jgi:hypothetical protein
MNSLFTFLIAFLGILVSVRAQDSDSYYNPVFPETLGSKKPTLEAVLEHYGPVRILNRWYVGAEGFLRNDKNTITNTFDGLINTRSISDWGFGASVGWVYREEWALEASYLRTPIHNVLTVTGSNVPLEYTMANDRNSLTLRAKRRLLFGKSTLPKSAFWIGVGISAIPNSGKQKEYLVLEGHSRQGRLPVDTLRLESVTLVNDKITGVVDASIEYILKPAKGVEFSVYGRSQWGLGNSVATKIDYTINRQDAGTSQITGNGSGWVFGVSLRYVFHTNYDFDNFNRSYNGGRAIK